MTSSIIFSDITQERLDNLKRIINRRYERLSADQQTFSRFLSRTLRHGHYNFRIPKASVILEEVVTEFMDNVNIDLTLYDIVHVCLTLEKNSYRFFIEMENDVCCIGANYGHDKHIHNQFITNMQPLSDDTLTILWHGAGGGKNYNTMSLEELKESISKFGLTAEYSSRQFVMMHKFRHNIRYGSQLIYRIHVKEAIAGGVVFYEMQDNIIVSLHIPPQYIELYTSSSSSSSGHSSEYYSCNCNADTQIIVYNNDYYRICMACNYYKLLCRWCRSVATTTYICDDNKSYAWCNSCT